MGYRLRRWTRDHMPQGLTPAERLLMLEVADGANDQTRECWADRDQLAEWCGLSRATIKDLLQSLASKGIELRMVLKIDKIGRPVYAYRGHPARYCVPNGVVGSPPHSETKEGAKSPPHSETKEGAKSPPHSGAEWGSRASENGGVETDPHRGFNPQYEEQPSGGGPAHVSLTIINGGQEMTKRSTMAGQMPLIGVVRDDDAAVATRGHPIVAGWIDYCTAAGVKLPRRLIGQYAKLIGEASREGFDDVTIKRALASMLEDNVANRPSLLPARLVQAQTGMERKGRRIATTDERVAEALDIARRMEEEDMRDEQG